jgi:hypothetical protein
MTSTPQRTSAPGAALSRCALLLAFGLCLVVTVFSWPDPQDRKRALGPRLAGCCEIRIANRVVIERSVRRSRQERQEMAATEPPAR